MPEYRVVEAFTDRPLAGNRAAVLVLEAPCPKVWVQGIAAEPNLSEAAFARRGREQEAEVDLRGHATLAPG